MDKIFSKPSSNTVLLTLPMFSTQSLLVASLSLAILIIALFIYLARAKSKKRGNIILLVGDEDAGKTAILTTMVYEKTLPTHTSFQVNSAAIPSTAAKSQLHIVDIPGHPRLRSSFTTHVPDAKAIVFVVDVSTITRNGRDVAEHLHNVLHTITSLPPTRALPPLLILAHKADLLPTSSTLGQDRAALAVSRVRTVLERELEKRRAVQAGGVEVEGLGAEGERTEMGGLECRASGTFKFSEWEGGEVDFLGTWVKVVTDAKGDEEKKTGDGLDEMRLWLDDLP